MDDTAECAACRIEKPLTHFYYDERRGKYQTTCRSCNARRRRELRYGITTEDYQRMSEVFDGRCWSCGRSGTQLNVDHCHDSSTVRGLLCCLCNRALGSLGDSLNGSAKALGYLSRYELARVLWGGVV